MSDSTSTEPAPVQRALTALVPIIEDKADELRELCASPLMHQQGLTEVGTVHFARIFVFPKDNAAGLPANTAAVITSYDGNFATYIQAFVNVPTVAAFFDLILGYADDPDAKDIIPVQKNAAAFARWVQKYDLTTTSDTAEPGWGVWYSAYPDKTVQNILAH